MIPNTGFLAELRLLTNPKSRNDAFANLTRNEQRMAIADEVLFLVESAQVEVQQKNDYIAFDWPEEHLTRCGHIDLQGLILSGQLYKKKTEAAVGCTVCAIGSCFLAGVSFLNNATLRDAWEAGHTQIKRYLEGIFNREELSNMEMFFEKFGGPYPDSLSAKILRGHQALFVMMNAIIESDGEFTGV